MRLEALLSELRIRGVRLYCAGNGLHYQAPKGALTPELRDKVVRHKSELLAVLAEGTRLSLDECSAILDAAVTDLGTWYTAGALPWAEANVPELIAQLRDTEAVLDALNKSEPTEADWRAAVTAYMATWREISDRCRAHRERGL